MTIANIECPKCRHKQEINIPDGKCLPFYTCSNCKEKIFSQKNYCCVICSYSDKKCPVSQFKGINE